MTVENLAGVGAVDTNALIHAMPDQQLAALPPRENIPVMLSGNDKDYSGIEGITPITPFA